MSASIPPAGVKQPRLVQLAWSAMLGIAAALTLLGVWVSWFDYSSRPGSPFLAAGTALLALWMSMRTWWLLGELTKALHATMAALSRSTDDVLAHAQAASSAAERLAAPGEGSGHPRPAERRSGPDAS
jgi:hypothetical protein